jgi:hypothetical protein
MRVIAVATPQDKPGASTIPFPGDRPSQLVLPFDGMIHRAKVPPWTQSMLLRRMQRSRLATFTHNFSELCNGDQLGRSDYQRTCLWSHAEGLRIEAGS